MANLTANYPVGVFDSGVGGLSVLRELRSLLPGEDFLFYGDNANAPYGERSEAEIVKLTLAAVDVLLRKNIKALVIACNTATSAAAPLLRERLPIPVVGMEPALKPAQALRHGGKILVMATPATLSLPKFVGLMKLYGEGAAPVPVRGLVERIQAGEISGPALEDFLRDLFRPYVAEPVDAAVLGCTHYIFARGAIQNALGADVELVDGNAGTARQLERLLAQSGLLKEAGRGSCTLMTSGDEERYMPLMRKLLSFSE